MTRIGVDSVFRAASNIKKMTEDISIRANKNA
jgi:hypothetical protein